MLEFGKIYFYHYRKIVYWSIGSNLGKVGLPRFDTPSILKVHVSVGLYVLREVLRFGKNLNDLPIIR